MDELCWKKIWFVLFFCFFFSLGFSTVEDAQELIHEESKVTVHNLSSIIRAIVENNPSSQELSPQILRKSRENFLSTFDKKKNYLLEEERKPFIDPQFDRTYAIEFSKGSFSVYKDMVLVIKKAIMRSRNIRDGFFYTDTMSIDAIRSEGEKTYAFYATGEKELVERIFHQFLFDMTSRLSVEREYDQKQVEQAVAVVEKEFEEFEHDYLLMSATGSEENQSIFATAILKSIMTALDAHSDMLSNSAAQSIRERLLKQTYGSGVECVINESGCAISKIKKGSPADRLGTLYPDDVITRINDVSIANMTEAEIADALNGTSKKGVNVYIVRRDPDGKEREVDVYIPQREYVVEEGRLKEQLYKTPHGNILYLELDCFYHGSEAVSSAADMDKAIALAKKEGSLAGIVIDLRKNGGGYITEAVKVVGMFIKTGVVLRSVYADGTVLIFRDMDRAIVFSGPLVVLTSYETASAAEIVAQALQDYGRAIIVGEKKTYGKGTIQMQTITDVSQDGGWLHIPLRSTIGTFYTASGRSPQGIGVPIDIVIPTVSEKRSKERPLSGKEALKPPLFYDPLNDIQIQALGWYQEHYLPFLQHPSTEFRQYIPYLARESARRVDQNPLFTRCLEGKDAGHLKEKVWQAQKEEGLCICKDLINVSSKKSQGTFSTGMADS